MTPHSSHSYAPEAWRCSQCGALIGSIDAQVRCDSPPPPTSDHPDYGDEKEWEPHGHENFL